MRRAKTYNEELSLRLQNPSYAKDFILALMEGPDAFTLEDSIRQIIAIMGVKEFSKLTGVPSSNLVAFAKARRNLKVETLDLLLKPFKLKTKLVIEKAS